MNLINFNAVISSPLGQFGTDSISNDLIGLFKVSFIDTLDILSLDELFDSSFLTCLLATFMSAALPPRDASHNGRDVYSKLTKIFAVTIQAQSEGAGAEAASELVAHFTEPIFSALLPAAFFDLLVRVLF
jgi:hypothetical protein